MCSQYCPAQGTKLATGPDPAAVKNPPSRIVLRGGRAELVALGIDAEARGHLHRDQTDDSLWEGCCVMIFPGPPKQNVRWSQMLYSCCKLVAIHIKVKAFSFMHQFDFICNLSSKVAYMLCLRLLNLRCQKRICLHGLGLFQRLQ